MFKKFTNGCVNVINRWLPDPFLFAIILSIVVFVFAMLGTGQGPVSMIQSWGNASGFWSLLAFAMHMAMVLVLGYAMASAPVFKRFLARIAAVAKNKRSAIVLTTFVSVICCWLNWGFGLIAGALLAKEMAKRIRDVDYRLLIASAYSGFVIWHAGLSGSIPLTISGGYTIGEETYQAGMNQTVFHPMNLIMCGLILFVMPFVNYAMHPDEEHTITVDPALLENDVDRVYEIKTPADRIEHSKILWLIIVVAGFAWIVQYFMGVVKAGGSVANALNLNVVNFIFLFLGLLMHGNLRRYVDAIGEAAGGSAGVLLQFPFYAGIMGMMVAKNADGVSLAGIISDFFVNISTDTTFPLWTFLSAGIVNFFVPSGGGQWAVQGPIVMPAAAKMGIEPGRAGMAIAWGDQWTNMIQPFWALPALGVAGLSARDIMGFLVIVLLFTGIIACGGFLIWAALF